MSRLILRTLANRVRASRRRRGWSRSELSRRSGISVRFLARVESGEGNISVSRLEELARALTCSPADLITELPARRVVVLLGMRGAGKSTVGPLVARGLGVAFVELDRLVVERSGLPLEQLFDLHGEAYYRRREREALGKLVDSGETLVAAASGGVVNDPATWSLIRERTIGVRLRAEPEDHWSRVVAQGDARPMADNPEAMQELRALLLEREERSAEAAITVDTSGRTPEEVARIVEREIREFTS